METPGLGEGLDALEAFLVTTLGKGVVRAKDTPNFIANRLGVFSMLATMANAQSFGIPFDASDRSTSPETVGSPWSGLPGKDVTHLSRA